MKTLSQIPVVFAMVAAVLFGPLSTPEAAEAANKQTKLSKEVIKHEDGKDRHWLVKSNALILEEHGLTAHGDLHVMVEYPKGVQAPQIDAPTKDTNIESVATMFWSSGTLMSRTPMIGQAPNGQDFLWWPNGKLFREAQFVMGTPTGLWNYYDKKGKLIGNGAFQNGKRQSGLFIGDNRSGFFFFFTLYPMKQQKFENGVLTEEVEFMKEPDFYEK